MARTILAIAQEAANRENTAPPPATLFGTNDRVARILRVAIHDTMRDVMRSSVWSGSSVTFVNVRQITGGGTLRTVNVCTSLGKIRMEAG